MNFVKIQQTRVNLDNVICYSIWTERRNTIKDDYNYGIRIQHRGSESTIDVLNFIYWDEESRDKDIFILDTLCISDIDFTGI